jgi:hypothetical protein
VSRAERLSPAGRWAALLALAAAFLATRPYFGVRHDARLYFGDVLARLDPGGVGRDIVFGHDGQFGFSLYTPVLAALVRGFGLNGAAILASAAGLALWFAALVFLAHRLLASRQEAVRWFAVLLAVLVSPFYGAFGIFSVGEPFATPRILAEAVAMAAFGLYLGRRRWLAAGLVAASGLFHPILALCGLGVLYVAFCFEDRRWLFAALAGLILLAAAVALRLPLADRLTTAMGPAWRALCEARSPTLFLGLWPVQAWGALALQAVTAILAAALIGGAARRLWISALVVTACGLAVSLVLGDGLSSLLVLQVQPWRAQAMLTILAALGLAICLLEAPARGAGGVLAAGALAIGWTFAAFGPIPLIAAAVAAIAALVAWNAETDGGHPLLRKLAWAATIAILLPLAGVMATVVAGRLPTPQGAGDLAFTLVARSSLVALVVALVGLVLVVRPGLRPPRAAALGGAAVLLAAALAFWDARTPYERLREAGPDPVLTAMLAPRPGAVLWLTGDMDPWMLARRPIWATWAQGAGAVFSEPLATTLDSRISRLVGLGLVGRNWSRPMEGHAAAPARVTPARRDALCRQADAPAWIVAPLAGGQAPEPGVEARVWRPPSPQVIDTAGAPARWMVVERYAVIPCAGDS